LFFEVPVEEGDDPTPRVRGSLRLIADPHEASEDGEQGRGRVPCALPIVQEGVPEVIPVEMCHLGWQESLVQLAHLVEPDIPG
jgi:hypothetical protein